MKPARARAIIGPSIGLLLLATSGCHAPTAHNGLAIGDPAPRSGDASANGLAARGGVKAPPAVLPPVAGPTGPVPAPPPALPPMTGGVSAGAAHFLGGLVTAPAAIIAGNSARLSSNNGNAIVSNNGSTLIGNAGAGLIGKVKSFRVLDAAGPDGLLANALVYLTDRDERFYFNTLAQLPFATTSDAHGRYGFPILAGNGFPLGKDVVVNAVLDGNLRLSGYSSPQDGPNDVHLDIASTLCLETLRGDAYGRHQRLGSYAPSLVGQVNDLTRQAIQSGAIAAVTTATDDAGQAIPVGTFDLRLDHLADLRNQYAIALSTGDAANTVLKSLSDAWQQLLGNRLLAVTSLVGNGSFPDVNTAQNAPVIRRGAIAGDRGTVTPQTPLGYPMGVAVAQRGDVFVAAYTPASNSGYIRWIKPNGRATTLWLPNFPLVLPAGITVEREPSDSGAPGTLLVADYQANRVYRLAIVDANQVDASYLAGDGVTPLPAYATQIVAGEYAPTDAANEPLHPLVKDGASAYPATSSGAIATSGWRLYEEGDRLYQSNNQPIVDAQGNRNAARYAHLDGPADVKLDELGNLYILDQGNNRVRMIVGARGDNQNFYGYRAPSAQDPTTGQITAWSATPTPMRAGCLYTIAGNPAWGPTGPNPSLVGAWDNAYAGDGQRAQTAGFSMPNTIAFAQGTLYVTDYGNQRIRGIARADGTITTVAGNPPGTADPATGFFPAGLKGDGGPAAQAQLSFPLAITVDARGRLYIADDKSGRIRMLDTNDPQQTLRTVAGRLHDANDPASLTDHVTDGEALHWVDLYSTQFLAADGAGNILLTDLTHNRLRKLWRTWE